MGKYAKTPTVFQMEATECGAASLCMVFAYFGKHLPLEQMRLETGVSRDGCNAGGLMRAAKRHGLACRGCRKQAQGLRDLAPPCILHWDSNHFVVLEGFKGRWAYINDPAAGRRRLSFTELKEGFSGVVLTFSPTGSFVKEKGKSTLPSFARERLQGQYGAVCRLLFTGLLLLLPGILFPMAARVFIDGVLLSGNTEILPQLAAFLCGAAVLQAGLALYHSRVLAKLRKKTVLFCARDFLTALFRLPIRFFDQRYPGDLASRVDSCAGTGDFLAGDLPEMALDALGALVYLTFLLACSPALTAIAGVSVLAGGLAFRAASGPMADASVRLRQEQGRLAGAVCAGLDLTADLKASGTEDVHTARVLNCHAKAAALERSLGSSQGLLEAIPGIAKGLADLAILLAGASLVLGGRMTPGSLAAFLGLFGFFTGPVGKLAGCAGSVQAAKADMGRVEDILRYGWDETFDPALPKADLKTKLEGAVELRGVTFGYNPLGDPALSGFDLRVDCGSSVALVGASGCGKSTLLKVLDGLYRPWSGDLLFDGIPAEEIPLGVRNASVSMVGQQTAFFPGTVRENLTMWNPHISEEDLIAAAKDACIHDVILQKPGGYDFRLREGASNLSGGQRQRLEIARALATNPAVLLMDEATSALDTLVEKQILDNIRRRGCTCVIAAHRPSAVRDCDEILVLEAGRVVEQGSHEALLKAGGAYQKLVGE